MSPEVNISKYASTVHKCQKGLLKNQLSSNAYSLPFHFILIVMKFTHSLGSIPENLYIKRVRNDSEALNKI